MGIGLDVIEALRRGGHDAIHLREQGLHRLADDRIVAKAAEEARVLLAHDLDMSRLIALSGARRPSLITFRLIDMTPPHVLLRLMEVIRAFGSDLESGAAVTVTDGAIRCHPLPIQQGR